MAVIAGWMAGYVMAIAFTLALTYFAVIASDSRLVRMWTESGTPPVLLFVPISIVGSLTWTMIGLVIGSAYHLSGMEDDPGPLGIAALPVLIGVIAVAVMPMPLLLIFWPRQWWAFLGLAVTFVLAFGWLMPLAAVQ